jgi:hypothetical protein
MIDAFYNNKKYFKRNAFVKNKGLGFACNMKFRIVSNKEFFRGSL